MPSMTLDDLVTLYILQKECHASPDDRNAQQDFDALYEKLTFDASITAAEMYAPSLFKDQPPIPFILFKPNFLDIKALKPIIIHTHGGPQVHMDVGKRHAEIAYFLTQGYWVACVNYRGSTGYPALSPWLAKAANKHHIYGPQDVYVVAKHVQSQEGADPHHLVLRGGGFGSYINAHLLIKIARGKFDPIFKGVHLSGGVNYPPASLMPKNMAFFVSHGKQDAVAPFSQARLFIETLLLRGILIQTFVAEEGDHYLINPRLQANDTRSEAYQELRRYLALTTSFVDCMFTDRPFPYELTGVVSEDFADYLSRNTAILPSLIPGAASAKNAFLHANNFFETQVVAMPVYLMQQAELYAGRVQNAKLSAYGDIVKLSIAQKTQLQASLRQQFAGLPAQLYLISLCFYLKGYTYYNLLQEAAEAVYFSPTIPEKAKPHFASEYEFFMQMVRQFSTPNAAHTQAINSTQYDKLCKCIEKIKKYPLQTHHDFWQEEGKLYHRSTLWHQELSNAVQTVRSLAYLAKERGHGQDISERLNTLHY